MEKTNQRFDESLQKLDEKFERRLELRIEQQRQGIEGMLASFGKMIIDVLDKRTTDLDNRMESRFSELRHDMTDVKERLDRLQSDMD